MNREYIQNENNLEIKYFEFLRMNHYSYIQSTPEVLTLVMVKDNKLDLSHT